MNININFNALEITIEIDASIGRHFDFYVFSPDFFGLKIEIDFNASARDAMTLIYSIIEDTISFLTF